MAERLIKIYRRDHKIGGIRFLRYGVGSSSEFSNIKVYAVSQRRETDGSWSNGPVTGPSSITLQRKGYVEWQCSSSTRSEADIVFLMYLKDVPETDNEWIYFPNSDVLWRVEVYNENGVLICDNGLPFSDTGKYPDYSKDYWKNAPTLAADEVQDDLDVFKLICTPDNLQADSIALYGAVGAGDPELIETKATAASISFNVPIADLDPGTYTFTAVPVKGTASGIASTGVELVIPEPEPEPEP